MLRNYIYYDTIILEYEQNENYGMVLGNKLNSQNNSNKKRSFSVMNNLWEYFGTEINGSYFSLYYHMI